MDDDLVPRLTAAKVAGQLKRSVSTVRHAAVTNNIGTLINPRLRLFSDADVKTLKAVLKDSRGRPPKPAVE